MYEKLSIARLFWHSAIFRILFCVNWWISSSHSFGLTIYWSTSHNLVLCLLQLSCVSSGFKRTHIPWISLNFIARYIVFYESMSYQRGKETRRFIDDPPHWATSFMTQVFFLIYVTWNSAQWELLWQIKPLGCLSCMMAQKNRLDEGINIFK